MENRLASLAITAATLSLASMQSPSPASADVRTEARRYFRQGMTLVAEGELDRGIAFLQQAYDTLPHPNVLFNIARAYAEAGRFEDSIEYFERYLESDPPDRDEVRGIIDAIRERAAAQQARDEEARAAEATRDDTEAAEPAEQPGPAATPEEIAAIEDSATQIDALAEVTESDTLRQRADRLRELARSLRERNALGSAAGPSERAPAPTGGAEPTGNADTGERAGGGAQEAGLDLGGEAASDVYEERVVSASRFAQSPLDSPNSTTTVTGQDIRLTGHTNPAALLRRAAGVEVMEVAPQHYDVSIRGLNQRLSNKVLVLIDGRSVYLDFLGATFFEMLPLAVEDVERIEVIRGPASALYGADAFTGIVNLITRDPGEGPSWVSVGGGSGSTVRAATGIDGRSGGLGYRLGGGYEQTDHYELSGGPSRLDVEPFAEDANRAYAKKWFSSELRYRIGEGWVARGGVAISADSSASLQGISRLRDVQLEDGTFAQSFVTVSAPFGLTLRSFWNHLDGHAGQTQVVPGAINVVTSTLSQDVADVELEYSREVDLLVPHNAAIGVGYRFKSIRDWDWLDGDHREHHFSAYLQDIVQLADPLRLQLSVRADRHPLLDGVQISPRGSVVFRLTEGSAIRGTVGYAFRSPTFLESYLELRNPTPVRGATALGIGNHELEPERITSFEIGYSTSESDYFAVEVNAYYNLVDNQILFTDVYGFTLGDFAGGHPLAEYREELGAFPLSTLGFVNEEATFRQIGGEAGIRVFPVTGLDVYANYAVHDTAPATEDDVQGARADERRTSLHKVNVGVQYRSGFGLDASVDFHWVSGQEWVEQVLDLETGVAFRSFDLPSYSILNARVGYRLMDDHLELGVVGTNLIDPEHREHPFGQPVDRRFMGTAMVTF